MAANDPDGDPARGTGPDKVTEIRPAGLEAPPHELDNEAGGPGTADPARGGCLKLGWGCLPVLLGYMLVPAGLFF